MIYDFSHKFVMDCQRGRLLGHMWFMLGTYVNTLCNWLIIWQNTLYLYLGRSRMCLILQETCCSSLVLKPWRLDQETSEEKLFTKARQIARHLQTDSSTTARQIAIYRGLMRLDRYYLLRYLSRIMKISFSDLISCISICMCLDFLSSQP